MSINSLFSLYRLFQICVEILIQYENYVWKSEKTIFFAFIEKPCICMNVLNEGNSNLNKIVEMKRKKDDPRLGGMLWQTSPLSNVNEYNQNVGKVKRDTKIYALGNPFRPMESVESTIVEAEKNICKNR